MSGSWFERKKKYAHCYDWTLYMALELRKSIAFLLKREISWRLFDHKLQIAIRQTVE